MPFFWGIVIAGSGAISSEEPLKYCFASLQIDTAPYDARVAEGDSVQPTN